MTNYISYVISKVKKLIGGRFGRKTTARDTEQPYTRTRTRRTEVRSSRKQAQQHTQTNKGVSARKSADQRKARTSKRTIKNK